MPRGKVIEFTQEKGFGKVELEDGTVLNFDASVVSSFDINPGDEGEVELRKLGTRQVVMRFEVEVG